jgi:hypothetical protein
MNTFESTFESTFSKVQVLKGTRLPRDDLVYTASTLVYLVCGLVIRMVRSAMLLLDSRDLNPANVREDSFSPSFNICVLNLFC